MPVSWADHLQLQSCTFPNSKAVQRCIESKLREKLKAVRSECPGVTDDRSRKCNGNGMAVVNTAVAKGKPKGSRRNGNSDGCGNGEIGSSPMAALKMAIMVAMERRQWLWRKQQRL